MAVKSEKQQNEKKSSCENQPNVENNYSFEDDLQKLEKIAKQFDDENISISQSIELFEDSLKISANAVSFLKEANGKVKKLKKEMDCLFEEDMD